jgi:L-lactate permease
MLFGMPAESFWAFAIGPIAWIVAAIFLYRHMKKTDILENEAKMKEGDEGYAD